MRDIIENFLKKEDRESIPLQIFPIETYENILKDFGYEIMNQETNGWQVDFWIRFSKTTEHTPSLVLSGSLMYGGYFLSKI